jgi:hypothetical protein
MPITAPTTTLRDERVDLGDYDVTDGELVYLRDDRPSSQLHVRTLATGEERVVDTHSGERCNPLGLQRAGNRVALAQYCGTRLTLRDDRVQVITLDGDPVVTVQDTDVSPAVLTDRFVTVNGLRPLQGGAYAYDLERRRMLRLSNSASTWYGGDAGHGERLAWSSGIRDGHGRRTVFADLR